MEERAVAEFWRRRAERGGDDAARFHSNHTPFDRGLLATCISPGRRVLDLGCGTCTLANWVVAELGASVHAVDFQPAFLADAMADPRLTVECTDVRRFATDTGPFDVVLLFGVIQHVMAEAARRDLYARIDEVLAPDGILIVKSQFGLTEQVDIDTYSEALDTRYISSYPALERERDVLGKWFAVDVRDVFPPALSPYPNTSFRHLICHRPVVDQRRKGPDVERYRPCTFPSSSPTAISASSGWVMWA